MMMDSYPLIKRFVRIHRQAIGHVSTLLLCGICLCCISRVNVYAQRALRHSFGKKEQLTIGMKGGMQVWLRHLETNPGTLSNDKEASVINDASIRRYRLKFYGEWDKRTRVTVQFGNNNFRFHPKNHTTPVLLDAYIEYEVHRAFAFGLGKNAWTGLSRYSAPSTFSPLALDINFMAIPFVNIHDDFLRRYGAYAKGKVAVLDYRFSMSRPKKYPKASAPKKGKGTWTESAKGWQYSTYLKYDFWEQEPNRSPFHPGTYLGKKRVFNIGAGYLFEAESTQSLKGGDTLFHDARSVAIDMFMELPTPSATAFTGYVAYIHHDFGPGFIRNIGGNDPSTRSNDKVSFNGKGNRAPIVGTGHSLYLQAAYLKRFGDTTGHDKTLQAFIMVNGSSWEALDDMMLLYEAGCHYYLKGQWSKLSLVYQNRPIYYTRESLIKAEDRKGFFTLQYQFKIG